MGPLKDLKIKIELKKKKYKLFGRTVGETEIYLD